MNEKVQPMVIDLHVHPSLKIFLFNKKLYRKYPAGGSWNPFSMRVSLPRLQAGRARAIVTSVYLPEPKMIRDCFLMGATLWVMSLFNRKFRIMKKENPIRATVEILNHFEHAVAEAQKKGWTDLKLVRSVIHAVEGAHSLNGEIANLQELFNRGVCMLTLAHFYQNEVTQTVGGIPSDKKFIGCFKNEAIQQGGLSEFGHEVVQEMFRLGMIVDLTHCTPKAREEVFEINNNQRPLVFSHTGVSTMNSHPMNPTDEEIKMVAECGGIIGTIFMNHWLAPGEPKNGLNLLVKTIRHVVNNGGIESVAIGSDFDGFTDPPDDIKNAAQYPKLAAELEKSGFTSDDIEKIFVGNARRLIESGWGKN
ncbi:MAG: membrane dipeptidase [Calditrichota bacterium]